MNRSREAELESRKMKIIMVMDWKDGFETVQKMYSCTREMT